MSRGARCGPLDGAPLPMFPSTEMGWDAWRELHPETLVVSGELGFGRDYRLYPYGDYEDINNPETLFLTSSASDVITGCIRMATTRISTTPRLCF